MFLGGVISSIYSVYQIVGFKLDWKYTTLFNNNPTFVSYANSPYLSTFNRAFAFTPEPSVFSSLLIPAVIYIIMCIMLYRKNNIKYGITLFILLIGLVNSASASMFISLPIIVAILLIKTGIISNIRSRLFKILMLLVLLPLVIFLILIQYLDEGVVVQVLDRINNIGSDHSLLVRLASMKTALLVFSMHPILGFGVIPSAEIFINNIYRYLPIGVSEEKTGVDSIYLNILAGQGLLGFAAFFSLIVLGFIRSKKNDLIFMIFISINIIACIQTGYILLYHIWVFIGLSISCNKYIKNMSAKRISLHERMQKIHHFGI